MGRRAVKQSRRWRRARAPGKSGQLDLGFTTPRKPRRGRRPKPPGQRRTSHLARQVCSRYPLHVTLRLKEHVWQLRSRRCYAIIEDAFVHAAAKGNARIVHFSVQHNHVHLLVEARDVDRLARTMQSFTIRVAKALNRLMHIKKGAVFADRYHSRSLKTPGEVRAALVYVLNNAKKHFLQRGERLSPGYLDKFSSGPWFDGWAHRAQAPPHSETYGMSPVVPAATWLLTVGWRERGGGRIRPEEMPST